MKLLKLLSSVTAALAVAVPASDRATARAERFIRDIEARIAAEAGTERRAASLQSSAAAEVHSKPITQAWTSLNESHISDVAAGAARTSNNWGGAVLTSAPSGSTWKTVSGSWTVPVASRPPGVTSAGTWTVAPWVGIDGYTQPVDSILQGGTISAVTYSAGSSVGVTTVNAWYEWFPNPFYYFDFAIDTGDKVTVSVDATSKTQGTVTVNNLTKGTKATKVLTAPNSGAALSGQNAEWIVEDVATLGGSLVPFAQFSPVTFTSCKATAANGATQSLTGATLVDLAQSGKTLASASIASGSSVKIVYG